MKTQVIPPRMQRIILCSNAPEEPRDGQASDHGTTEPEDPSISIRTAPAMNTTNLRKNEIYGNEMQLPKADGTSRLISMNINGMRRSNEFQDASKIASSLKVSSADLISFQETNLNWPIYYRL